MNERHKGQLKIAHQIYDNRNLGQELVYQREFLDTGYLSYQQVCFNKWIFDECLKRLEKLKEIGAIVNDWKNGDIEGQDTIEAFHQIKKVIEQE